MDKKLNQKVIQKIKLMQEEDNKLLLLIHEALEGGDENTINMANTNYSEAQAKSISYLLDYLDLILDYTAIELGDDLITAAFLLILHYNDPKLSRKFLPKVIEATSTGISNGRMLALLMDKILIKEQKPQLYGTQRSFDKGRNAFVILEFEGTYRDVEDRRNKDNVNTEGYESFKAELLKYGIVTEDFDFEQGEIPFKPV